MAQWMRDPEWPAERPWERAPQSWRGEQAVPKGWLMVDQGAKAIDIFGREVNVGDRVAVAMTVSRSANLRVGRVVAIVEEMEDDWGNWGEYQSKPRKVGKGTYRIKCEWETSTWDNDVKASAFEAGLPKYIKL